MNRPFTFYPNTLSLGSAPVGQGAGMNVEWRLIFKDQLEKFSHAMEIQMQQQLQNYTSGIEIMLNQQGVSFQAKLEEMQQSFSRQLLQSHGMLLDTISKHQSLFQSHKDNLSNAVQKIKTLHTAIEKQAKSMEDTQKEMLKTVNDANVAKVSQFCSAPHRFEVTCYISTVTAK